MVFDEETVRAVWAKGSITADADPEVWRKDEYGAWIRWGFYRDHGSQYGWDIDYVVPRSEGGGDDLLNLRPLHWRNRTGHGARGGARPVTAQGWSNVSG
jgi:hypothetical protein